MDIQARKIQFVQQFLRLKSEEAISRFEKLMKKEVMEDGPEAFEPMTIDEFNARIDASMEDSKNGRLVGIEELNGRISQWLSK